jgi:excinuclease ABC subunit C
MWSTIKLLQSLFPLRRCKGREVEKRTRPCLNHQMQKCLAPCVGKADEKAYQDMVRDILLILEGRNRELVQKLKDKMAEAAGELQFEKAALYRDQLEALQDTLEKQVVAGAATLELDVFGFVRQDSSVAISVITVRHGRVLGQQVFFLAEPVGEDAEILAESVKRYYAEPQFIPVEILFPFMPDDHQLLGDWLSGCKEYSKLNSDQDREGKRAATRQYIEYGEEPHSAVDKGIGLKATWNHRVVFRVPVRGDKTRLIEMAQANARQVFSEQDKKEKAWDVLGEALARVLHLVRRPDRIECLDISNISGQQAVGSLVCFEKGQKAAGRYRHFKIRTVEGPDDYLMMAEVLERRLKRGVEEDDLPDLLVVDGGKGQLNVAVSKVRQFSLEDRLELAGIAKEKGEEGEKIYRPGRKNPILLARHSPLLLFLMKIRDESHRYGVTFHRRLRHKAAFVSELDKVPGIGPARKKQLLTAFGSLENIKKASVDELASIGGVGPELAATIHEFFLAVDD